MDSYELTSNILKEHNKKYNKFSFTFDREPVYGCDSDGNSVADPYITIDCGCIKEDTTEDFIKILSDIEQSYGLASYCEECDECTGYNTSNNIRIELENISHDEYLKNYIINIIIPFCKTNNFKLVQEVDDHFPRPIFEEFPEINKAVKFFTN